MRPDRDTAVQRLLIFAFYDADGVVDRRVPTLLEALRSQCARLTIVSGGPLKPEARRTLTGLCDRLLLSDARDSALCAYRDALEALGSEETERFDELVLMSDALVGPVYSLDGLFGTMAGRDVDFWGIDRIFASREDSLNTCVRRQTAEHIPPYFIALRRPVLCSEAFRGYFRSLPKRFLSFTEEGRREDALTVELAAAGFRWDSFLPADELRHSVYHPLLFSPLDLVRDRHCPLFLRGSLYLPAEDFYSFADRQHGRRLIEYLRENGLYDVDLLWESLLRTEPLSTLRSSLDLNYILSSVRPAEDHPADRRCALLIRLTDSGSVEPFRRFAASMPEGSDIWLSAPSRELLEAAQAAFHEAHLREPHVFGPGGPGRSAEDGPNAAGMSPERYDAVCVVQDGESRSSGSGVFDFRLRSLLESRTYVENILALLAREPRLGLLFPPTPCSGVAGASDGSDSPTLPMFWFRPSALRTLPPVGRTAADSVGEDGAFFHIPLQTCLLAAQNAGFYSAEVLPETLARGELTRLSHALRETNTALFRAFGPHTMFAVTQIVDYFTLNAADGGNPAALRAFIKYRIKVRSPRWLWLLAKKAVGLLGR